VIHQYVNHRDQITRIMQRWYIDCLLKMDKFYNRMIWISSMIELQIQYSAYVNFKMRQIFSGKRRVGEHAAFDVCFFTWRTALFIQGGRAIIRNIRIVKLELIEKLLNVSLHYSPSKYMSPSMYREMPKCEMLRSSFLTIVTIND